MWSPTCVHVGLPSYEIYYYQLLTELYPRIIMQHLPIYYIELCTKLVTCHCKKGKVVLTQFGYLSFETLVCIIKHSGVPLPALDSTQIKNLIWLSRTSVNVMREYFANEIVQSCGKGYETEVTTFSYSVAHIETNFHTLPT